MILSIGIRCVDRQPKTIDRTLQSARQAGLADGLCVFADGMSGDSLPSFQGQLIQREPRVGAWPNFFLSLAEMYLRKPEADLYLLLEDDVVFCRDIRPYLEAVYSSLEVASLFTSAKVERWISPHGVGFHRQNPGWNVSSGGQAWIFSNKRLREFLRSEFVVNYRKSPPQNLDPKHYRKDGLYHTDSVVGQFCREAGCGIQYHYPSLAQHIGDHSFMFPDLTGKRDIRFSEHFPGEEFSAMDFTQGDAVMPVKSTNTRASCAILVPAQGAIEPECERSLRALEQRGYAVRRVYGYAAIDQARNQMATDALREGFTETMWIDSDIAFNPDDVDKLREHNLPICSAMYPKKGQRKLASHVLPGTEKIVFGKGGGLLEIMYAATGFLLVRREAYQTIEEKLSLPTCNLDFGSSMIPFFQPMILDRPEKGPWYLAEDFSFSERARRAGFQVYADTTIRLKHLGQYGYTWEDAGSDPQRYGQYTFHVS